ncbi:MCP four helix bundle domain-containing protein [Geodermatophilus sp. SYSU D00691]
MSAPVRPPARSARWFTDRPVAVTIGVLVALMALGAVVTAVLTVRGAQSLRDGELRLHQQDVEPLVTLGAIQRSFQGDRVRVLSYTVADPATRADLRADLEERQGELQALIGEYDGSQADEAAWSAFTEGVTACYAATERALLAMDHGAALDHGAAFRFGDEKPLAAAVMDPYAVESDAQAAAAADSSTHA